MHGMRGSLLMMVIVVLLLGVLATPLPARAQGSDRPVGIGGKASWHLNRVRGEAVADAGVPIDFGTGTGFSIGGLLTFAASPNVTVQPELLYSRKNFEADVIVGDIIGNGEIDTDWFEIPVIAKLHGERSQGARPFALVGLTLSFLVNAEQTLEAGDMREVEDIKDDLTSADVGLSFGGGVDFLQDWGVFTLDARYTFGLRNLADDADVKQDTFAISGGFIF